MTGCCVVVWDVCIGVVVYGVIASSMVMGVGVDVGTVWQLVLLLWVLWLLVVLLVLCWEAIDLSWLWLWL